MFVTCRVTGRFFVGLHLLHVAAVLALLPTVGISAAWPLDWRLGQSHELRDNVGTMPTNSQDARAPRPASGALTKTGGFLAGFTHTLQPYIGCAFGCAYCYVQGLAVHHFHRPTLPWGDYVHPRVGIEGKLRRELGRHTTQGTLDDVAIFMSSATDPYQGSERHWRLSRKCLAVMEELPPALLVLQTRSPLVRDDFEQLARLGDRAWLSITLETDQEEVRQALTPRAPSLARRIETIRAAHRAGLQVQTAVSPCLPYSSTNAFADLLADLGQRVVIDSFLAGDGSGGRRTAATATVDVFESAGWGDWRCEDEAHALYAALQARIGPRVGWSSAGFTTLATVARGVAADPSVSQPPDPASPVRSPRTAESFIQ